MEPAIERKHEIKEEQIILPLTRALEEVTPKNPQQQQRQSNSTSITDSLNELFPEQERYDKDIKMAKQALGTLEWEISLEQLQTLVPEVQYLCESWLDDFERTIFKGLTLKELLHEKGGK